MTVLDVVFGFVFLDRFADHISILIDMVYHGRNRNRASFYLGHDPLGRKIKRPQVIRIHLFDQVLQIRFIQVEHGVDHSLICLSQTFFFIGRFFGVLRSRFQFPDTIAVLLISPGVVDEAFDYRPEVAGPVVGGVQSQDLDALP